MFIRVISAVLTRLANTTAYAVGDLLANHATAGSVVPLEFAAARYPGGNGRIKAVRILKSGAVLTDAAFRVHFFKAAPSVTNGDNGAFLPSNALAKGYIGAADVTVDKTFGDGAAGRAACDLMFDTDKPSSKIYALIETTDTYTPASAEIFTVEIEVERD